jgi:hypothetical protein
MISKKNYSNIFGNNVIFQKRVINGCLRHLRYHLFCNSNLMIDARIRFLGGREE